MKRVFKFISLQKARYLLQQTCNTDVGSYNEDIEEKETFDNLCDGYVFN